MKTISPTRGGYQCFSFKKPWAHLLTGTPDKKAPMIECLLKASTGYRGPLIIYGRHDVAASGYDWHKHTQISRREMTECEAMLRDCQYTPEGGRGKSMFNTYEIEKLVAGFIGVVALDDVIPAAESDSKWIPEDVEEGFVWSFSESVALRPPYSYRNHPGIFSIPGDILASRFKETYSEIS